MAIDPNDPNAPAFGGQSALGWLAGQIGQWLQTPQGQATGGQTDPNAPAFGGQSALGAFFQWLQSQQPPTAQAAAPTTTEQPAAPTVAAPAAASPTPEVRAGPPPLGPPAGPGGTYTVDQIIAGSDQELNQANADVARLWDQITAAQTLVTNLQNDPATIANPQKLTSATSQLNTLYTTLASAQNRLEAANTARASMLQKAIDAQQVTPSQVNLAQQQANLASANANTAKVQADVLTQGAPGQRDLVAAQAVLASSQALAQNATAAQTTARTPAEVNQLQAQANQLSAQAAQIQAQIPLLQQQARTQAAQATTAEAQAGVAPRAAEATTGTLEAQRLQQEAQARILGAQGGVAGPLAQAQLGQAQANIGATQAQTVGSLATAQQTLANMQKGLLGPTYGLQDQINAIRAIQGQVFGPGGSGSEQDANNLLQDYINATLGGTTTAQAAAAAGNLAQQGFATQAGMANAAQAAQAARANAFQALGGNVLSTLAQMNANAPAGSTAGAAAFTDIMNQMAQRMQAPQFAAPQQPAPPALPTFFQKYFGGQQGAPQASAGPPPNLPSQAAWNANAPPGIGWPGQATWTQPGAAPQTSAPVTINIGGGAQPSQQTPAPAALPSVLQGYAPASVGGVMQNWNNELQSGAVKMPAGAQQQQQPTANDWFSQWQQRQLADYAQQQAAQAA